MKPTKVVPEPKRNDPCTCGSGKKFKKCCMNKEYLGPIQELPKKKSDKRLLSLCGMIAALSDDTTFFR